MRIKIKGFTLVELVIVIILLGILSGFIVARFADLKDKAIEAKVTAAAGSFRSAIKIAHSKWLVSGHPTTITMEGQTVPMSGTGWPGNTTLTATRCRNLWSQIQLTNEVATTTLTSGTDQYWTLGFSTTCYYVYSTYPPLRYFVYNNQRGTVTGYGGVL